MIISILIILILFMFYSMSGKSSDATDSGYSDNLVLNYYTKPSFSKRVVLVIEAYDTLHNLNNLIKNILSQTFKVNSIILINRQNIDFSNDKLIKQTCIINKIGELSIFFKEREQNTIILFLFPLSFTKFENKAFLDHIIHQKHMCNDLLMVNTNEIIVDIDKVYK